MTDDVCAVDGCQRPPDGAFVCKPCAADLARDLADVPWLVSELNVVLSRQVQYVTRAPSRAGGTVPSVYDKRAADVLRQLNRQVTSWVVELQAERRGDELPRADTAASKAAWLRARVEPIRQHKRGGELVSELGRTRATALRVIDRPLDRQFLGMCIEQNHAPEGTDGPLTPAQLVTGASCPGRVYGKAGARLAVCNTCGTSWPADELREHLLRQLDDRLVTAAEIAQLSTHLGLRLNREQVRKRVNAWHSRRRIYAEATTAGAAPLFRFGIVWRLLAHDDARRRAS